MSWIALDVDYRAGEDGAEHAYCAAVAFDAFTDARAAGELAVRVDNVKPYVPGRFFEREMPCLLAAIDEAIRRGFTIDGVLIDGYVWLDHGRAGLGAHLHEALRARGMELAVIGVAKTKFDGAERVQREVLRGRSSRPLYVTCEGIALETASQNVRSMAGEHRVATLLARVDRLCRDAR